MRLFIAIDLPEQLKDFLEKLSGPLSKLKSAKVLKRENAHLTLFFLGEITNVEEVTNKLRTISFKPFDLETSSIGFFPNIHDPKVVWLGLKYSEDLKNLQTKIASEFGKEEDYNPHLTFSRFKHPSWKDRKEIKKLAEPKTLPVFKVKVTRFRLYSSELTPVGSIYNVIETFEAR